MSQIKTKKEKVNFFSNLIYSFKIIYKVDKVFVIQKLIVAIFGAFNSFFYAYILKVAIDSIEKGLEFKEMVIEVLLVVIVAFIVLATIRIVDAAWYRPNLISMILSHQTSIRTLDIDYDILERPETQDALEKCQQSLGAYSGAMGLLQRFFLSLQYFLTFLIASAIIISVNWILVIIIILLSGIKIIIENKNQRRRKKEVHDVVPPIWRKINYSDSISGNLTIAKDLRVYKMDNFINQEREKAIDEYVEVQKKDINKNFKSRALVEMLAICDGLFLYGFMIYEVIFNGMSIADFTFMVASVFQLIRALYQLIRINSELLLNSLEVNDYRKFMNIEYVNQNQTEDIDFKEVDIEFRNVYFSYYMQEGYALENVSFRINAGEKIALVGYNGAGKTTIVKLLTGLYKPTKGMILINGIDITKIRRDSLAKIMSPVFQETVFFPFSIDENIKMAFNGQDDIEKINDIIKLVKLEDKINSLPDGIKTILSRDLDDKGVEFSGGESQKLSLARAIYKDNQVFILDEPTSALDAISEYEMYKNFDKITNNNTTIYISHRLSSTRFCDRIILLDKGKINEEGSHDELMKNKGTYSELFNMQAKYYQEGEEIDV